MELSHFIHHRPLHLIYIQMNQGISINYNTDKKQRATLTALAYYNKPPKMEYLYKDVNIRICLTYFNCRPASQSNSSRIESVLIFHLEKKKNGSNILHVSVRNVIIMSDLHNLSSGENEMDCPWTVTNPVHFSCYC